MSAPMKSEVLCSECGGVIRHSISQESGSVTIRVEPGHACGESKEETVAEAAERGFRKGNRPGEE
jgi:hypothetical protein